MDAQILRELKRIAADGQVPMSERMVAAGKYQEALDELARKATGLIEQIKSTREGTSATPEA